MFHLLYLSLSLCVSPCLLTWIVAFDVPVRVKYFCRFVLILCMCMNMCLWACLYTFVSLCVPVVVCVCVCVCVHAFALSCLCSHLEHQFLTWMWKDAVSSSCPCYIVQDDGQTGHTNTVKDTINPGMAFPLPHMGILLRSSQRMETKIVYRTVTHGYNFCCYLLYFFNIKTVFKWFFNKSLYYLFLKITERSWDF